MGKHPPETALYASMRAHTAQTRALLWDSRWDVLKAAGLYALLMTSFFGVFAVEEAFFASDAGRDGRFNFIATAFLLIAFTVPPLVLLHSLGHRARGAAVTFRQSIVQTAKRMPRLAILGVYTAVFCFSWLFVLYFAAAFLLALPIILAITLGGEEFFRDAATAMFVVYGVFSAAGLFTANAILVRTALLAPLFILVDGLSVTKAWLRSSRAMSWRRVVMVSPLLVPCMAYAFAPSYFFMMNIMPSAVWLPGFMAMVFIFPPICLGLALAASVTPWQGDAAIPTTPPADLDLLASSSA